jgi:23S rRNA (pseudouridine1915-N3)-methyltransferase
LFEAAQIPFMRIRFLWVGKTKNSEIKSLVSDYLERICRLTRCEIVESRDLSKKGSLAGAQLIRDEGEELGKYLPENGRLVALDEEGAQFTSPGFAKWLEAEQNRGTRLLTFVIGGPEGLSPKITSRAHLVLSLGKMTWTHDMCRVLVMEQIYRALCIIRKIPYHKGSN